MRGSSCQTARSAARQGVEEIKGRFEVFLEHAAAEGGEDRLKSRVGASGVASRGLSCFAIRAWIAWEPVGHWSGGSNQSAAVDQGTGSALSE